MPEPTLPVTYLFSDIEGSTRLWEQEPERMRVALARHDAIARATIERHHGVIVKMKGDGVHAAFDRALDAVLAVLEMQQALVAPHENNGIELRVRCGLHCGVDERRDNDFYGREVNRAARIMDAAHGGQVLLSQAVVDLVRENLPVEVTLRDLGTVRLRDLADPERVYQVLHPRLRADFPPLRSLEATPNNLPQQLNSFVNREREMAEVRELLGKARLITLLGMGGIGKSRLSVQFAAKVLEDYSDGVWLVELAALTDPQLVPQAVASVLGVKEETGYPLIEALAKYARDKRLLIILDNCEHVIHACAEVAKRLLQSGPTVRILATSRRHLQVAGEWVFHVSTLSPPDPNEPLTLSELTKNEAVRLFVDRAAAAQPSFRLNEQTAAAVAEVSHRLDGIPLAIELAAARTRAMPIDTIAARLCDRFRLLVTGDRTVLARQRTLRALIDWSYDLLPEKERTLFQRLSVFAGGWTLEAAEAICAGGETDEAEVLDLLSRLVEESLVILEADGARYRMLDTVRHYAQERLNESGQLRGIRKKHLDFYLALAEQARPQLAGPNQAVWLRRLDIERENLYLAHGWSRSIAEGPELGLRLVYALRPYWLSRGLLTLGHQMAVEVLDQTGTQERSFVRCRALFEAGQISSFMGRYKEARSHLIESLAIAKEIDNQKWVAFVLQPLGIACLGEGDSGAARRYFQEALELARHLADKRELAAALNALAQLHRMEGSLEAAEPLYEEALGLAREFGDKGSIAISLLNLAMVSIDQTRLGRAKAMLAEALAIAVEVGSKPVAQSAVEVCAGLAVAHAQWAHAARFFGAAEAQIELAGASRDPVDDAFLAPLMSRAKQMLGDQLFLTSEAAGRSVTLSEALAEAEAWLSHVSP